MTCKKCGSAIWWYCPTCWAYIVEKVRAVDSVITRPATHVGKVLKRIHDLHIPAEELTIEMIQNEFALLALGE